MTPILVFDIETLPDVKGLRRLNNWEQHLTDQEVVDRAMAARREAAGTDFMSLPLHQVAVIGCVFRDDRGFQVCTLGKSHDSESVLLSIFFKAIEHYTPCLVSWNGSGFDLPVLHYRSLLHGIAAPRYWELGKRDQYFKHNNYVNRYHQRHVDLMEVLAKYQTRAYASLDDIAKLCGFPGKLGMDGSKVWQAWNEGQADAVRAYCETDVVNTWLVYCRFCLLNGEFNRQQYDAEIALVRESLSAKEQAHWKEYLAAWHDG